MNCTVSSIRKLSLLFTSLNCFCLHDTLVKLRVLISGSIFVYDCAAVNYVNGNVVLHFLVFICDSHYPASVLPASCFSPLFVSHFWGICQHNDMPLKSEPGLISLSNYHLPLPWRLRVSLLFLLSAKPFISTAIHSITKLTWSNGLLLCPPRV